MRASAIVLAVCGLSLPAVLGAQGFTGTFVMQGERGPVTLTLQQDAAGAIAGRMEGGGVTFTVEGTLQGASATGAVYDASGGMYFQATRNGARLVLTLYDVGQDGQPDYGSPRQLVFQEQTGAPGAVAPSRPFGSKPPARGAVAGGGSALLGAWACQTAEGPARLVFRTATQLEYNGTPVPYELAGDVIRAQGEYGVVDYRYRLAGDVLTIQLPDASTMQCRRQAAGGAAAAGAAPAPNAPGGLDHMLQGMMCSYATSATGGYSRSTRAWFDGRGGFAVGTEASWNVESGSGYSSQPSTNGRYRVQSGAVGGTVTLQFPDGTAGTAQVHHVYQGRIVELMYEGTLFSPELC